MKTLSQKCLLHIGEGRIRTVTGLRKLNNGSHRQEAASRRVSHSTCGGRTDSAAVTSKRGFQRGPAGRQGRGGERSGTCKAGRATGWRAAGSSTATCSAWRRKWQGGVGDEVASCIHFPFVYPLPLHVPLFPWQTPNCPSRCWSDVTSSWNSSLLHAAYTPN